MPRKDLLNLFNANPPPDELLSSLFCGREREMSLCLDTLASRSISSEILAVYGETRSGKSHFVRVALKRLPAREGSWRILTINANNRGATRPVLHDVFEHLWQAAHAVRPKVAPAQRAAFDAFLADQDVRQRWVAGEHAEASVEVSAGTTESTEQGLELKLGGLGARAGGRAELRRGASEKHTVRAPTDLDLVAWVRDLLDCLREFEPERPVLLFVDDLDLLHRRGVTGSAASEQLVDLLKGVAEHPQVQVLVTIRAAYFNGRDKDFHDFIQLPLLDDDSLREIYRRHVEVLHDGVDVLSPPALDVLAEGANGQVGMFLKMCRDLFRWGYQTGVLGEADVTRFIDHQLRQLRLTPEAVSFMPAIEQAIREGRLSVKIDDDLQETPLLHTLLHPVPGQRGVYLLNGIWSRALARGGAA
ncbi:MAG: AAA family ATPase [Polyangiales bacterium]